MDDAVLKVALAGLMHDIGKLAQDTLAVSREYLDNNAGLYQPFDNKQKRHTHIHTVYTAAFIEQMADMLPQELTMRRWGEGDVFVNLAAGHHKPDTAMQWLITQADRLSSGLDRDSFEKGESVPFREFRSTRLLSILEALSPDPEQQKKYKDRGEYRYHYPLAPLSSTSIFPVENRNITKEEAQREYENLFNDFVEKLSVLPHRHGSTALWAEHFDSLLAAYCSQVPAARAGDVVPDVSLYDHCRTTAALSTALYLYHRATDSMNEKAIKDDNPEKFLLVSGDFYGIQDFIFAAGGEQQRLRAKLLRGRSFAVSLFSELAADAICRTLDLPFTSVFLNAAGKFHLIAPNVNQEGYSTREVVEKEAGKLNDWLFKISYGQASLGVSMTPASPVHFERGTFASLWERHLVNMDLKKYQRLDLDRHGGVVNSFLDNFDSSLESLLCPFCAKRPSEKETENDVWLDKQGVACAICRDHIMMGANLVKGYKVALFDGVISDKQKERLIDPIFGRYQLKFYKDTAKLEDGPLIKFWQMNVQQDGSLPAEGTVRLINGHVPLFREDDRNDKALLTSLDREKLKDESLGAFTGRDKNYDIDNLITEKIPKTFNSLAAKAKDPEQGQGTEALGVMKADIDNLGLLMSCGMSDDRFTISRMSALSRRLDQFFTVFLPSLLADDEEFQDIYTVFAGGDDLFLIGPWNRMAPLALRLRHEFDKYVAGNDREGVLTFSAGITLHKTHVPVDKLAAATEEALEEAKGYKQKNRVTMFGQSVRWRDFYKLLQKQEIMAGWLKEEKISKVMFYRFNNFMEMADKEKAITSNANSVSLEDMECLKWPALFNYSMERNIRKKGAEKEKAMQEIEVMADWLKKYGSAMSIPLWSQLYSMR